MKRRLFGSFSWPRQHEKLLTWLRLQLSNCDGFISHEEPFTHFFGANTRCCQDCLESCYRVSLMSRVNQVRCSLSLPWPCEEKLE